ncbi:MAG TPA: hypothetical protein VFN10_15715 [Thermoanaerobaculia bacterium]|nr:hypothetical protein [Thermoanaerobaculia bacterium]
MIKRLAVIMFALLTASAALADFSGAWTASLDEKEPGRIYFSLTRGRMNQTGTTMRISYFAGLSDEQIHATSQTPVNFRLQREAGTVTFEGIFKNGNGAGQFNFAANRNFENALTSMGLKLDRDDRTDEQLFAFTLFDVSTDFIRTMRAEGFDEDLDTYMSMRIFNVTPDYIHEMRDLGYKKLDADDLVATRIHKVTPEYIRGMRAAGFNLSLDDYMAFRIHKVTLEFINELATLGYRNVDNDDLVAMRIHKVTPEFIRDLKARGYSHVPIEKMIEMRIAGVDGRFLDAMNKKQ